MAVRRKALIRAMAETILKTRRRYFLYASRQKLLYLSIPKNANSFVKAVMLCNDSAAAGFEPANETALQFAKRTGGFGSLELLNDGPLFDPAVRCLIVIRDPIGRLVSAYLDKFVKPEIRGIAEKRDPVFDFDLIGFYRDVSRVLGEHVEAETFSFRQFISYVCAVPDYRRDKHYRCQSFYARVADGLNVDAFDLDGTGDLAEFLRNRGFSIIPARFKQPVVKRTTYSANQMTPMTDFSARELASQGVLPPVECLFNQALLDLFARSYKPDIEWYSSVKGSDLSSYLRHWKDRLASGRLG